MINLAPGKGLGRVDRPFLAVALGYLRSRSTLPPQTGIIGELPGDIISAEPLGVISDEQPVSLVGEEIFAIAGRKGVFAIVGNLVWNIISKEAIGTIESVLPGGVTGAQSSGLTGSKSATTVESDESDDIISEEP